MSEESGLLDKVVIQAAVTLLVSGPKYDIAPEVESATVQRKLLSLCRACVKGKNLSNCCQPKPKVVLETPTVHAWRFKEWIVVSGVVSRVVVLGAWRKTGQDDKALCGLRSMDT